MAKEHTDFDSFWLFYLREHSQPKTRVLHYIGTTLVITLAVAALVSGNYLLFIAMPIAGYFFAWIAHWRVERNRPATFTYPLWSLIADFKMYGLWLTGRLDGHLQAAGIGKQV